MTEFPIATVVVRRQSRDIAVVTLNRPDARNALNRELVAALISALGKLAADSSLRALVITGNGQHAFSAGADLIERERLSPAERTAHTAAIEHSALLLAEFPVPVIAAINGYALAGGAELAVACELRVASASAVLGFPEVRIGIFPGAGGVVRLPRLVGASAARKLLYTGRHVDAVEAERIGLVDQVAPGSDALPTAMDLAKEIAANAPLAVRALKRALNETTGVAEPQANEIAATHRRSLDHTADYAEGLAAFREKRTPRFTGQ